jgi:hypothetical protein
MSTADTLKLKDSIFDTSFNGNNDWNFNITKDTILDNKNSNIGDTNNKVTTETNNSSWWDGIGDFMNINNASDSSPNKTNPSSSNENGSMFSSENIGSTLKGTGAIVGALSGIYGTLEQAKFNKEALGMEKDRINRNIAREDKLQKNYEGVWS